MPLARAAIAVALRPRYAQWVETAASYAIAGMVLARLAILRRLQMSQIADFLTMQVPLIVPVIWVELMRYHSVEHAGFVVRSFVVFPIFALLASLALMHKSRAPISRHNY